MVFIVEVCIGILRLLTPGETVGYVAFFFSSSLIVDDFVVRNSLN